MNYILKGKSQKGKNRIREHGNKWKVIRQIIDDSRCSKLLMEAPDGYWKWMKEQDDPDLEIVETL